jgi:hypothetical protein
MGVLFTKLVNLRVLRNSGAAQSRSINMLRLAFNLRKESHVCLAGRMVRIETLESRYTVSALNYSLRGESDEISSRVYTPGVH